MNRNSIKQISLRFTLFMSLLISSLNLFAADVSCENCNKVPGMPSVETRSIEKVVEGMAGEKAFSNISDEEMAEMCSVFLSSGNSGSIRVFLSKFKMTSQNPVEAFTRVKCTPDTAYPPTVKIPLMHYVPEFPTSMHAFIKQIHDFFVKKENNPNAWIKVINLKNQKDMTLLDLINFQLKGKYITPETKARLNEMRDYLCKNGGEFSYYKSEEKCTNQI